MIYFDNAATAMIHPVLDERLMDQLHQAFANPSSLHRVGMASRKQVERVRGQIAQLTRVKPREVIFTSGGTEANNIILQGSVKPGDHIITSAIEHASIHQLVSKLEGVQVSRITDMTLEGVLAQVRRETRLVSIMHVNNETGQVFDMPDLYRELNKRNIRLHRDAVQSFGKFPLKGDYDYLSLSGHKLGAFKGTGALIAKQPLQPGWYGGDQERGLRPGTENVPGILSLGLVLEAEAGLMDHRMEHVASLNQRLRQLLADDTVILSPETASPYILSLSAPGIPSEVLLNAMSAKQMYFSVGSACSSRSKHHSHVIAWLTSDPELRAGAMRLSLSWQNTWEEVEVFSNQLIETIQYLRKVIR